MKGMFLEKAPSFFLMTKYFGISPLLLGRNFVRCFFSTTQHFSSSSLLNTEYHQDMVFMWTLGAVSCWYWTLCNLYYRQWIYHKVRVDRWLVCSGSLILCRFQQSVPSSRFNPDRGFRYCLTHDTDIPQPAHSSKGSILLPKGQNLPRAKVTDSNWAVQEFGKASS